MSKSTPLSNHPDFVHNSTPLSKHPDFVHLGFRPKIRSRKVKPLLLEFSSLKFGWYSQETHQLFKARLPGYLQALVCLVECKKGWIQQEYMKITKYENTTRKMDPASTNICHASPTIFTPPWTTSHKVNLFLPTRATSRKVQIHPPEQVHENHPPGIIMTCRVVNLLLG